MVIKIKTSADVPYSEVTPEPIYRSRRDFMKTAAMGAAGAVAGASILACDASAAPQAPLAAKKSPFTVNKPGDYGVEDLVDFKNLEERVYRLRCVEAWSMVIPWIGVPFSSILAKVDPRPAAQFVEFTTLERPSEMPGLRTSALQWPYVEGLRMDEARHPLTLMVVGLYGKVLPNQNGAPLRIHSPWKYGFKGGKSIVRIRFMDTMPRTSWAVQTPHEYGFYANVNPTVDHPRWSQARERRLPSPFRNHQTEMFNGYGDQVASLYAGMDLRKYY
jgi:sulfoxide reductase catalytic subunit YedY